jgi:hypothetical protein
VATVRVRVMMMRMFVEVARSAAATTGGTLAALQREVVVRARRMRRVATMGGRMKHRRIDTVLHLEAQSIVSTSAPTSAACGNSGRRQRRHGGRVRRGQAEPQGRIGRRLQMMHVARSRRREHVKRRCSSRSGGHRHQR